MKFYRLMDDNSVVESSTPTFDDKPNRVALDITPTGLIVSTVFLAIDHNYNADGPPLVFETMVFGLPEETCGRYTTWDDAIKGHIEILKEFGGILPIEKQSVTLDEDLFIL